VQRILKSIALAGVLFIAFSLTGCGSSTDSTKDAKKDAKTAVTAKQAETNNDSQEETKVEPIMEEDASTDNASISSEEKKTEPSAAEVNTSSQSTQPNQSKTATNNTNSSVPTNKSTATTASPPSTIIAPSTTTTPDTPPPTEAPKPATTVTFSIVGSKERGTIIASSKVSYNDGDTIFDIIKNEAKKQGIVVESRGSGATAYIEGIDNIYEFDYGVKSGWVFEQNGVSLTKSIGLTKVKDGDRIECFYTE
jgi:hypothetical protein